MSDDRCDIFFADHLERFGDAPALISADGTILSYRQLAAEADAFKLGIPADRRLLILEALNEPEAIVAYLGALRGRHPILLIEPGATSRDDRIARTFSPYGLIRRNGDCWGLEVLNKDTTLELHPGLCILLSTSGSTGSPTLVRLSRKNVSSNAEAIVNYLELTASERAITSLPFQYSYGLSVVNSHLAAGATLLLTEEPPTSRAFWDFFERHGATSLAGVPHTFEQLDRIGFRDKDTPSLRYVTQAGGRLARDKLEAYASWAQARGVRFYVMYGQTEAAPRMAYVPPARLADNLDCIGQAIPGGQLSLIDESGAEIVDANHEGELVYRGPNVMLGYAYCADDLARGRDVSELHTGDLACRDTSGLYRIVGRKSRFAKVFGLRIGLDEIEALLAGHGIEAATCSDDRTISVFTRSARASRRAEELVTTRYRLGRSAFAFFERNEFPRLATGKIDYGALEREAAGLRHRSLEGTTTLRDALRTTLGIKEIRDTDTFTSLGGDSLSYVEISVVIEKLIGYLPAGWDEMPIQALESLEPREARGARLNTDILLRVVAITGVLCAHASGLHLEGGSNLLLVLAGLSLARFQRERLYAGKSVAVASQYWVNFAIPYYVIALTFFFLAHHLMSFGALVRIATLLYLPSGILYLWFLTVLLHSVAIFCSLFWVTPFRRWAQASPWSNALTILVAGFGVHFAAPHFESIRDYYNMDVFTHFFEFALGWCLYFATTDRQKTILAGFAAIYLVSLVALPVSEPWRGLWVVAGVALLLSITQIRIPRWLHAPAMMIGSASFYIYIAQRIPLLFFEHTVAGHIERVVDWTDIPLIVPADILLGLALWRLVRVVTAVVSQGEIYMNWRRRLHGT